VSLTEQQASDRGHRIVLLDPRAARRQVMRHMLATAHPPIEVVGEVGDEAGAIALVTEHDPDAVLVEVQLPIEAGLAAIRGLRRHRANLRIIVCSFHGEQATRLAALAHGADAYLQKPVNARELQEALTSPVVAAATALVDSAEPLEADPSRRSPEVPSIR
jgi:DNA-binding NarL/FixJ family response regulator